MLDNQLIALVIATIIAQEATAGIPGMPIKQAFQPTQQGVNKKPTAYLHIIHHHRTGWPLREDIWVLPDPPALGYMTHIETQQYETTFQISTLATQDPADVNSYTPSDILNLIAYILQNSKTIDAFEAQNIGILRIQDVQNPYFVDDRDRHEAAPILEFTLTHKQIVSYEQPVIESYEIRVKEV